MMNSSTEIVCSFKDTEGNEQIVTGKNAILTEYEVNYPDRQSEDVFSSDSSKIKKWDISEPITFNLQFKIPQFDKDGGSNFLLELLDGSFIPKRRISKLRVEDCSIEELLFAVRSKIK